MTKEQKQLTHQFSDVIQGIDREITRDTDYLKEIVNVFETARKYWQSYIDYKEMMSNIQIPF